MSVGSIEVRDFTKTFGPVQALAGVSLAIHDGEVLGLIGPNGAGKTTMFECLAGQLPADRGQLRRNGQPLTAPQRIDTLFYIATASPLGPPRPWGGAWISRRAIFGAATGQRFGAIAELQLAPLLDTRMGALSKGSASAPCWRSPGSPRNHCCWSMSRSTGWTSVRRATSARGCVASPPKGGRCSCPAAAQQHEAIADT